MNETGLSRSVTCLLVRAISREGGGCHPRQLGGHAQVVAEEV